MGAGESLSTSLVEAAPICSVCQFPLCLTSSSQHDVADQGIGLAVQVTQSIPPQIEEITTIECNK